MVVEIEVKNSSPLRGTAPGNERTTRRRKRERGRANDRGTKDRDPGRPNWKDRTEAGHGCGEGVLDR